jgi:hypothetical protein
MKGENHPGFKTKGVLRLLPFMLNSFDVFR